MSSIVWTVERMMSYLDEVLALWLGHERLKFGCGEGVDQARLGHNKEEDLRAGEDREFVRLRRVSDLLLKDASRCQRRKHTFFMMPALRLEKVMCRRDLSWMNLISIFLLSRPGLSSSSSSSSAAALVRDRLTPLFSTVPLPFSRSSCSLSGAFGSCATWCDDAS